MELIYKIMKLWIQNQAAGSAKYPVFRDPHVSCYQPRAATYYTRRVFSANRILFVHSICSSKEPLKFSPQSCLRGLGLIASHFVWNCNQVLLLLEIFIRQEASWLPLHECNALFQEQQALRYLSVVKNIHIFLSIRTTWVDIENLVLRTNGPWKLVSSSAFRLTEYK